MKEAEKVSIFIFGMALMAIISTVILFSFLYFEGGIDFPEATPTFIPDQVIATNDDYLQPYLQEKHTTPVANTLWSNWNTTWQFYNSESGDYLGVLDFSGAPYDDHFTDNGYRVQITNVEPNYLLVIVTNLSTGEMYADCFIYQSWDNSFLGGFFNGYRLDK